ncbi:hypothetical protein CwatDRAFT_0763 [Crocosphaera watsonii WH 8501]|uniref:Transposase DDE domain-containing protein n=1 Tax=Crocosphaera watsonii WH 8501 TaxID=165597 RepID=Q4BXD8_CROWT|nr:hypothetical protein CwatDRAFT_0763 [Crocosphaera watsonii WH 8501]
MDKKLGITEKFGNCFQDHRHQSCVDHSVHELLAQRLYGIILGYEDVNDHDKLRHDPALKIALEKLNELEDKVISDKGDPLRSPLTPLKKGGIIGKAGIFKCGNHLKRDG